MRYGSKPIFFFNCSILALNTSLWEIQVCRAEEKGSVFASTPPCIVSSLQQPSWQVLFSHVPVEKLKPKNTDD